MKTNTAILTTLFGLLLGSLHAQTTVPSLISYQGKVADSTGAGIGTGTPVNRKVIFRIFSASTGGVTLWTEEQNATFSNGDFSVLLGSGTAATGTAAGETHPALDTIFTAGATDRYLEILVDNGDNVITGADLPISPRQRLTSTAFTLRARSADTIASGNDLIMPSLTANTDNGLGWYGTGRTFAGLAINGPVLFGNSGGALGTKNGSTQTIALRWDSTGNVTLPGTITGNGSGLTSLSASSVTGTLGAGVIPSLDASKITTGTLASSAIIPNLDAAKITTGIFDPLRIPTLDAATKITGTLPDARLSANMQNNITGPVADSRLTGNVALLAGSQSFTGFKAFNSGLNISGTPGAGTRAQGLAIEWNRNGNGRANLLNQRGLGTGGISFGTVDSNNNGSEDLILDGSGNLYLKSDSFSFANSGVIYFAGSGGSNDLHIRTGTPAVPSETRVIVKSTGLVGIGTTDPVARLHVKVGTAVVPNHPSWTLESYLGGSGAFDTQQTNVTNVAFAIKAEGYVLTDSSYYVSSDARIKIPLQRSDSAADLALLSQIQITDYQYKDTIAKTRTVQKKVIAQEVEKVFPQAVTKTTDVVPDIFAKAKCKDGWLELATNLKQGERVKLITEKDEGSIHEVLEVTADRFRTDFRPEGDKVFVYGREVKDFRVVDYDAISMLNVSATQQIKKEKDAEVKALQDENEALRKRVTALEAADKARDAKLAAIEKALLSADKSSSRTVSLKPAESGK